jgi:Flp pilus assembly protein TadG
MKARSPLAKLLSDQEGATIVEVTIMMSIIFVFVLGLVDLLFAFYQWNAAAKAVQVGARIAAVSSPVATGLNALPKAVVTDGLAEVGDPMPAFTATCSGGACSCTGTCNGVSGYNATAMNDIVYGRGRTSCGTPAGPYSIGMCNAFYRVAPANVRVVYTQPASGGIGFAGRSGGPAGIVTIELINMNYQFIFLGQLLTFANANPAMPPFTTSVSAEDLCSLGAGC